MINHECVATPRYSGLSLPDTPPHLPGRHGHAEPCAPTIAMPDMRPEPPAQWADCEAYLFGADLYNAGYWYEAKSVWRSLAQLCGPDPEQQAFLNGLSATANALLTRRMGWRSGAAQSRGVCNRLLATVTIDHYMGLDLGMWRKRIDRCLRPGGVDFPRIELE